MAADSSHKATVGLLKMEYAGKKVFFDSNLTVNLHGKKIYFKHIFSTEKYYF